MSINIIKAVFSFLSRQYSDIPVALLKSQSRRGTEWTNLQTLQIFLPLEKRSPLKVNFFDVLRSVVCVA